jgi:hypothetical protein
VASLFYFCFLFEEEKRRPEELSVADTQKDGVTSSVFVAQTIRRPRCVD